MVLSVRSFLLLVHFKINNPSSLFYYHRHDWKTNCGSGNVGNETDGEGHSKKTFTNTVQFLVSRSYFRHMFQHLVPYRVSLMVNILNFLAFLEFPSCIVFDHYFVSVWSRHPFDQACVFLGEILGDMRKLSTVFAVWPCLSLSCIVSRIKWFQLLF